MSVLIWVQTVFKGYQQTTKVADSKELPYSVFSLKFKEASLAVEEAGT